MENIPTAEEYTEKLIQEFYKKPILVSSDNQKNINDYKNDTIQTISKYLVEFAKLHVEAQAEEILKLNLKNDEYCDVLEPIVSVRILEAYPLENIK